MRRFVLAIMLSITGLIPVAYTTAGAVTIDVTSGTSGTMFPFQSYNETRGVDVTVLANVNVVVSSMTLNDLLVGGDGMAFVGARIYSSPGGALLASNGTTVFANGAVTLPISATLSPGLSYRICFFCGPLGPNEDNSATLFEPNSFPYTESTGSLRINQAYESASDSYPTNFNIFDPVITMQADLGQSGVENRPAVQVVCTVHPATPSPFSATTRVRFELRQTMPVEASIVDLSGRRIRRLLSLSAAAAGEHTVAWDGTDDHGRRVVAGVYFLRLTAGATQSVSRVQLLR